MPDVLSVHFKQFIKGQARSKVLVRATTLGAADKAIAKVRYSSCVRQACVNCGRAVLVRHIIHDVLALQILQLEASAGHTGESCSQQFCWRLADLLKYSSEGLVRRSGPRRLHHRQGSRHRSRNEVMTCGDWLLFADNCF